MVHLIGIVRKGWYMVQESKLWYDYIVMVRSGNAASGTYDTSCRAYTLPQNPSLYLIPIFYSFDAGLIWLLTNASLQFNVLERYATLSWNQLPAKFKAERLFHGRCIGSREGVFWF